MWPWKKKENKLFEILKIIDRDVSKLEHEVEMIKLKFKSKFFKKKDGEDILEDYVKEPAEEFKSPDGLDDLRKIAREKDGVEFFEKSRETT